MLLSGGVPRGGNCCSSKQQGNPYLWEGSTIHSVSIIASFCVMEDSIRQILINAVTGEVDLGSRHMSGNATNQDFTYLCLSLYYSD